MCGIAGFLPSSSATDPDLALRRMLRNLEGRGPDSEGTAHWPGVYFGHRRLAILDLSPAGHQPMLSDDGQVGIVFNGCIYNFLELRAELEAAGYRFRSHCDTEVLLRGYEHWGAEAMAPRLRGMYAFAIWDEKSRELYAVRDRMGVKPFVYSHGPQGFGFASTAEALWQAGLTRDLDPRAVGEYLEYGFISDRFSIYKEAAKLPPASILHWKQGKVTISTYWTLPGVDPRSRVSFDEAVERTEELLIEAVRLRLQADVPIGALLSGGVDSTLVCWAMAKLNANVKAFTVGTPGDESDESAAASDIARKLGIPHEIFNLSSEESAPIEELLSAYAEPFGSESALGILHISRTIKPKATVLLTGDGGDDIFLGYPFFANAWRAQKLAQALPGPLAQVAGALAPLLQGPETLRRAGSLLDYASGGLAAWARRHDGLPYLIERGILGERMDGYVLPQRALANSLHSARHLLAEVIQHHWGLHFTGEFMTKVDGGTMFSALEARSPFLDHRLWEFAAQLPPEIHFHGGALKAVLREIVRRRVDPAIATRRKQGFTVPITRWLCDPRWKTLWDKIRDGSLLASQGWVHQEPLRKAVDEGLKQGTVPRQLWYLLLFEHWLERHAPGGSRA
jgi:asparagine synthase (glutamine-hydrolysing)